MPTTSGTPDQAGTMRGLAQAPLHLQNMVAELVDNSLAASTNPTQINIDLSAHADGGDLYILRVWDNGPGISLERLEQFVFKLGRAPDSSSHLNEHGFGLKNVLAKAQQLSTLDWFFRTRDSDAVRSGIFFECKRPFSFAMPIEEPSSGQWPQYASPSTGTMCEIVVPMTYLQSVAFGRRGALPKNIGPIMDYLREHLGVTYRGYLEGGIRATTHILTSTGLGPADHVDPISPDYKNRQTFTITFSLANQQTTITGVVGLVDKDSPQTKARKLYYRHAPESQGIDIRVGKRTVATRLIGEIWDKERHPSLNGVAGEFLVPGTRGVAPPTLNNKTSLDFDSPTWNAIAEAIRQAVPESALPYGGGKSEADLRDELYQHINGLRRPTHTLEKEYDCIHGVNIDIVWDLTTTGGGIDVFEVKKGKAAPLDLYQLVMYWDALLTAGKQPTRGHLVSSGQTAGVSTLLAFLRTRKDANGNLYDFFVEDWSAHGINP